MVDLSIIIVNFNTKDLVKNCIESIVRYTKKIKYEIIVVDNTSIDGSVDVVKKLSEKLPIKLIKNKKNLGFGVANNQGIKKARGRFVLLLNSDTVLGDDVLDETTLWLQEHPDVGVISCALKGKNGKLQCAGGYFPTLFRVFSWMFFLDDIPLISSIIKSFHPIHSNPSCYKGTLQEQERDWVAGTFFLARKKVFDQVGYFDRDYFMYTEDVDLCYRIRKAGWKVYYLPHWSIKHIGGASGKSWSHVIPEYKGVKLFYRKHYPKWQFPFLRIFLKIGSFGRFVLFGIIKGKEAARIYAKAFKMA